jgi:hypothetical protein
MKDINGIRVLLNKISDKTYDANKDAILNNISVFIDKNRESDTYLVDLERIAQSLFDIASTNKFYSRLYADLYKELAERFDIFRTILDAFIANYKSTIDVIKYVNPDVNYDEYCNYTKTNDKRKATASFVVMLMQRKVLRVDCVIDIICHFLDVSCKYMEEEHRTNEVDEITENIFVFVSLGKADFAAAEEWDTKIVPTIRRISKFKTGDKPSLSNRVIFKYMDIADSMPTKGG